MQLIKARLPTSDQALPVLSVILFFSFTWTLYVMFWTIPSWLGDMPVSQMLVLAAYVLSFALLESVLIMAGLLLLAFVLPARFFKDKFTSVGSILVLLLGLGAYYAQPRLDELRAVRNLFLFEIPILFLVIILALVVVLSLVLGRLSKMEKLVTAFAEKMTVFSYIYLPLGLLSFLFTLSKIIF